MSDLGTQRPVAVDQVSGLRTHAWKPRYATSRDDLVSAFYGPALDRSVTYDRAAGFFRSSFYNLTRSEISRFALRGGRIRLVCSPELTDKDIEAIKSGQAAAQEIGDGALRLEWAQILEHPHAPSGAEILSALLALSALSIRIAVPLDGRGLFHDKFGVFRDTQGDLVSFAGSVNETWSAWHPLGNHESFEVFTSWGEESQRPFDHRELFEQLWASTLPGLSVVTPSATVLDDLKRFAGVEPRAALRQHVMGNSVSAVKRPLMDHQRAALRAWRAAGYRGVLKHATGSGKTITALAAIREHIQDGRPALVLVPSILLLEQWDRETRIELSVLRPAVLLVGGNHTEWRRHLRAFTIPEGEPRVTIATMTMARSRDFLSRITSGAHLLLVADEVHRLGARGFDAVLSLECGKALGLSATPERAGDPLGTSRIFDSFGPVVPPEFTLADAIAAGRLCPYEYHIHTVSLTADEEDRWRALTEEIRVRSARGRRHEAPEHDLTQIDAGLKLLLIQRARVARGAANKAATAAYIVANNYASGQRWLVYCDDVTQLDLVRAELDRAGHRSMPYHSAMVADRDATLDRFIRDGGTLVAIKCLDEGVDIPAVSHAVIAASSRNPREFIQRRGRVLRTHRDKHAAVIYDLVVSPPQETNDDFRSLAVSELARAHEFALHALNASARVDLQTLAIAWDVDPHVVASYGFEDDES